MFATIWMCTQEWSLISIRTTAFTFATCHQPFSCLSSFTRSSSFRSLRLPRTGRLMCIFSTACAGVSLVSRTASAETGSSIRSFGLLVELAHVRTTMLRANLSWKVWLRPSRSGHR